jgi:glucokinase
MTKKSPGNLILGFDVGATKIISSLGDISGHIYKKAYEKTEAGGTVEHLLNQLWTLKGKVVSEKRYKRVKCISIAFPGIISKGKVLYSPNLPEMVNVNFSKLLASKFHKKIYLENDANAEALSKKIFGKGKNIRNFVYLTIGSGIGGAIVIDNKLYKGFNGLAGEIGHIVIMADGPLCGCNRHGCVEALASGFSISRRAKERLPETNTVLKKIPLSELDAKAIFNAKKEGDQLAIKIVEETAEYLAICIANIINILDPEAIVIDGGITKNNYDFIKMIRNKVKLELGFYTRNVKIIRSSEKLIEKAPIATVRYYKNLFM